MNHKGLYDITIFMAEVISKTKASPGDTYKRNENVEYDRDKTNGADMLFAIDVQYSLNKENYIELNVKPASANIKQIPIVGENVLIYQSIDHTSRTTEDNPQWYYIPNPIAIPSNLNTNILPTVRDEVKLDEKFIEREVSPLQPYRGDLMLEGRYGNSIRFGSTVDYQDDYSVIGNWRDGENGDPILIISNGRPYKPDKHFVTEDVSKDDSSLYLTSTQTLSTLKLSKTLTKFGTFRGSQFVGVADRAILRAKTEAAVIDADEAVILNTPGDVLIGGDDAAVPIPQGDVLLEIIMHLINAIGSGVLVAGLPGTPIGVADLTSATNKLIQLNSKKYKIKKT